ncbi:MAG: response regulator transcription factor [Bdellovibrionota bacterium]
MSSEILVIEDQADMQMTIGATLKGVCNLTFVGSLAEAHQALKAKRFDLCLLDIMLPDGDGFSFCAKLRNETSSDELPLFFLTGKSSASDKIQAFQLGADDYITKPFDPGELKARVNARLRNSQAQKNEDRGTTAGNIKVVLSTQRAFIQKENGSSDSIDLSSLEFRILHYFIRRQDYVISRGQLLEAVWGLNLNVNTRTVDTHISHLRKKMAGASHEIKAVKGTGYTLRSKHGV